MKHYNEYVDNCGRHYKAIPMFSGDPYTLCYYREKTGGWHRMKQLMVRTTLAEARKDLDEYAAKKGWTGIANKAIADEPNDAEGRDNE
jgi:hypothetical protein